MSRSPLSPRPRGNIDREILIREQDEMVPLGRRDSLGIPRTEEISVATSSRDRPVVTDFVSGPERRILFDNDDDKMHMAMEPLEPTLKIVLIVQEQEKFILKNLDQFLQVFY